MNAGKGELTAAKNLVRELNRDHHQYCDVIVADSLYINAPFINTCLRNNKDGEIVEEETTTHYFATTMEKIQLKAITA